MRNPELPKYDRLCGVLSVQEWREFYERQRVRTRAKYSILLIDIDNQKVINDYFGFQVGDLVIRHVASCLLYKVSWKPHPVWRIGGDEFIVFLRGLSVERANGWAHAISDNLKAFRLNSVSISEMSVTIGIADSYCSAEWERVVWAADNAVHRGKHDGRNKIVIAEKKDYLFPSEK